MHITDVENQPISTGKFAHKPCCVGHLMDDMETELEVTDFQVAKVAVLTDDEYTQLAQNLQEEREWLKGMGGYLFRDERDPSTIETPEEFEEWDATRYREVIKVMSQGNPTLFIDAQMKGVPIWVYAVSEKAN